MERKKVRLLPDFLIYPILFLIIPTAEKIANAAKFTTTILGPAGGEKTNEMIMPMKKHTTDRIAEEITTLLNVLNTRIEVSAGKMMRLEISMVPMMRIPTTIVNAVKIAIKVL